MPFSSPAEQSSGQLPGRPVSQARSSCPRTCGSTATLRPGHRAAACSRQRVAVKDFDTCPCEPGGRVDHQDVEAQRRKQRRRVGGTDRMACGPDGRVYIGDVGADRVQVFSSEGKYLFSFMAPPAQRPWCGRPRDRWDLRHRLELRIGVEVPPHQVIQGLRLPASLYSGHSLAGQRSAIGQHPEVRRKAAQLDELAVTLGSGPAMPSASSASSAAWRSTCLAGWRPTTSPAGEVTPGEQPTRPPPAPRNFNGPRSTS